VRTAVGIELATLGKALESRQNLREWPDSAKDMMPKLIAALQATGRLRIWTPDMKVTTWPEGRRISLYISQSCRHAPRHRTIPAQKQQAKRFRDILNKERPDSRKDAATAANHSA